MYNSNFWTIKTIIIIGPITSRISWLVPLYPTRIGEGERQHQVSNFVAGLTLPVASMLRRPPPFLARQVRSSPSPITYPITWHGQVWQDQTRLKPMPECWPPYLFGALHKASQGVLWRVFGICDLGMDDLYNHYQTFEFTITTVWSKETVNFNSSYRFGYIQNWEL